MPRSLQFDKTLTCVGWLGYQYLNNLGYIKKARKGRTGKKVEPTGNQDNTEWLKGTYYGSTKPSRQASSSQNSWTFVMNYAFSAQTWKGVSKDTCLTSSDKIASRFDTSQYLQSAIASNKACNSSFSNSLWRPILISYVTARKKIWYGRGDGTNGWKQCFLLLSQGTLLHSVNKDNFASRANYKLGKKSQSRDHQVKVTRCR